MPPRVTCALAERGLPAGAAHLRPHRDRGELVAHVGDRRGCRSSPRSSARGPGSARRGRPGRRPRGLAPTRAASRRASPPARPRRRGTRAPTARTRRRRRRSPRRCVWARLTGWWRSSSARGAGGRRDEPHARRVHGHRARDGVIRPRASRRNDQELVHDRCPDDVLLAAGDHDAVGAALDDLHRLRGVVDRGRHATVLVATAGCEASSRGPYAVGVAQQIRRRRQRHATGSRRRRAIARQQDLHLLAELVLRAGDAIHPVRRADRTRRRCPRPSRPTCAARDAS